MEQNNCGLRVLFIIRFYGPDLAISTSAYGLGEYSQSGPYNLMLTSIKVHNCIMLKYIESCLLGEYILHTEDLPLMLNIMASLRNQL